MAEPAVAGRSVTAAWGAWTGKFVDLAVPDGWQLVELPMCDAPGLSPSEIEAALDRPVGAERLETLASGRRRAAIAIDDITRPTRTAPIVSRIVNRLLDAKLPADAITVVIATGAHGPATAQDIHVKVGELPAGVRVVSHDPVDGVEDSGVTLAGQQVRLNREYLAADLRIGISGVMPHPFAAFSGGGKIVLPGLSDLDSVVRSHKYALMGFGGGLQIEGNRFRRDMERAVREIGLDWSVNIALNSRCETAVLAAGEVVAAHRAAADRARAIGETEAPSQPLDALVINAYPKDSELLQVEAALVAVRGGMTEWLKPGAPVILLGACPDGLGSHQLFGPGGRLFRKPTPKSYLRDHLLHVVSPAVADDDAREVFCDRYPYHASWAACAATLRRSLAPAPVVGFAPSGPLHVPMAPTWLVSDGPGERGVSR